MEKTPKEIEEFLRKEIQMAPSYAEMCAYIKILRFFGFEYEAQR